jgi:hypothetical protein
MAQELAMNDRAGRLVLVAALSAGSPALAVPTATAAQQIRMSPLAEATIPDGYVPEFGTMWTFDAPPLEYWSARYGFTPDQDWLDHVRLSAVRLPGCSASFVSADGLVMTNHHCVRGCISAVSPPDSNYLHLGFVAAGLADEKVCPNTYVDQLVGIEDVTARIRRAVTAAAAAEQVAQRAVVVEETRAGCEAVTGLRCQVVALYNGGMYSLYTYRRYDDLRLVMAPELDIAYFGGDPDNFTYPRYNLDVAFLRAYEDGMPVRPANHLPWSAAGAVDDELVFVVGNPGSTGRLLTLAQMEYLRDVDYPVRLRELEARLAILRRLSAADPAAARRYENAIFSAANTEKAILGYRTGLLDPEIMARKTRFETDFRARVEADPVLAARYGGVWTDIAGAQLELATFEPQARYYTLGGTSLLANALELVRSARQAELAESERFPGWSGERIERVRQALLRDRAVDLALERLQLESWLAGARDELGPDDALVRTLLAGRPPAAAAEALVRETGLHDVAVRRALVEGGARAIERSPDPLIVAARALETAGAGYARRQAELAAVISAGVEKLGEAIFAAYGQALPPDATFTLRISDGVVKGFPMNGTIAPYRTSFYGLFARSAEFDGAPPFSLPDRWQEREARLDLRAPLNFVATPDIIGGNSGSPVINRRGEVVGVVFDGNIEMLPNRFIFTDEVSRSVSVHSVAIIEALRKVYDAGHLADELERP